jgi:hypothetical protein
MAIPSKGEVGVADFYLPLNIAYFSIQDSICNGCSLRLFDVMFGKFELSEVVTKCLAFSESYNKKLLIDSS